MSVESATTGGGLMSLLPMVFIFAIFYFFLIRPQVKRQRKAQAMVNELSKGDKVVAAGGLYGTIVKIEDDVIFLEIADGVRIKALKSSVTETLSGSAPALKLAEKETKTIEEKPKKAPARKPAAKKPAVKNTETKK
jgi:preprotein translocase subunit YajC